MPNVADPGSAIDDEYVCPECGSGHLVRDYERGEVVCAACGLVLAERAIDHGPEWLARSAAEAERYAHTGPPRRPLYGPSALTTVVPFPDRDIRGRLIPEPARRVFHRLRRLQATSAVSGRGERSSVSLGRTLDRMASHLGLPGSVKDEASLICRRVIGSGILRGRSASAVVAAAVYAACRIDGVPRTLREMEGATGVPRKTIGRHYRELVRSGTLRAPPLPRPQDYVGRFCAELGLSSRARTETLRLLGEWDRLGLSGSSSPVGTAATAIYLAAETCGERRHQTDVARVTGVTEVTLRSRLTAMRGSPKRSAGSAGHAPRLRMRTSFAL